MHSNDPPKPSPTIQRKKLRHYEHNRLPWRQQSNKTYSDTPLPSDGRGHERGPQYTMSRPTTARPTENGSRNDVGSPKESAKGRPSSRRGVRTPYLESVPQEVKLERTFSRGVSTVSSQDSSGWRPPSGIARIQGTASRLVSAASHQRGGVSVTATPRFDPKVCLFFLFPLNIMIQG